MKHEQTRAAPDEFHEMLLSLLAVLVNAIDIIIMYVDELWYSLLII